MPKSIFLTNEQTLTRKDRGIFYAARLEMHYTKQDILEGYLNTLYFGHGVIGIKEAASYYFGKDLEHLDAGELAMLVGVVNGPGIFSPYINYENAVARQKTILQIMYEEDLISKQEYEAESNKEVIVIDHSKDENSDDLRSYYIDAVLQGTRPHGPSGKEHQRSDLFLTLMQAPPYTTITGIAARQFTNAGQRCHIGALYQSYACHRRRQRIHDLSV